MLITDRFVFVHVPKTGGDFIRRICLKHLPTAGFVPHQIAKHGPDTEIPAPYDALPRFALVRNPWDYYVSWYSFQAARETPNALFSIVSDDGRLGFAATVENLVNLGAPGAPLRRGRGRRRRQRVRRPVAAL